MRSQGRRFGFWESTFPNQLGNLCFILFLFLVVQFVFFAVLDLNIFDPDDFKSADARIPDLGTRRVVDEAGVLTETEIGALTAQIDAYEAASNAQMAVYLVRSLHGDAIEDFSLAVAEKWKIGLSGEDNGVLFLLAMDDRESRLEIGYGLEGVINDARAGDILRDIVPFMRQGQYAQAISFVIASVSSFVLHENGPEAPGEDETEYDEAFETPDTPFGPEDLWFLVFGIGILSVIISLLTAKILIHPDVKKSVGLAIMLVVGWIALRILILAFRNGGRGGGGGGGSSRGGGGGGSFGGGGASGRW